MRVCCFVDGNWLGHTLRLVAVAECLTDDYGCSVEFVGDGKYSRIPTLCGFQVHHIFKQDPPEPKRIGQVGTYWIENLKTAEIKISAEIELLKALSPDLVLCDYAPTALLVADYIGLPSVSLMGINYTRHCNFNFIGRLPSVVERLLTRSGLKPRLIHGISRHLVAPLNKVRRSLGLRPYESIFESLEGDLNLIADSPAIVGDVELPHNFVIVGPIIWNRSLGSDAALILQDLKEAPVYVTFGSNHYRGFLQSALMALSAIDFPVVFSATDNEVLHLQRAYPKMKTSFCGLADGLELMRRSRCVVCHGGAGTVYQAIAAHCPIVGIPANHDQEYYMHIVEQRTLGIRVAPASVGQTLERCVHEAIDSPNIRQNLQQESNLLGGLSGAGKAAQEIVGFFAHGHNRRPEEERKWVAS